jgi:hypothetical protein
MQCDGPEHSMSLGSTGGRLDHHLLSREPQYKAGTGRGLASSKQGQGWVVG